MVGHDQRHRVYQAATSPGCDLPRVMHRGGVGGRHTQQKGSPAAAGQIQLNCRAWHRERREVSVATAARRLGAAGRRCTRSRRPCPRWACHRRLGLGCCRTDPVTCLVHQHDGSSDDDDSSQRQQRGSAAERPGAPPLPARPSRTSREQQVLGFMLWSPGHAIWLSFPRAASPQQARPHKLVMS